MTINEAIKCRHTVRRFADKAIPAEIIELLNARIALNNERHGLKLKLVTGNSDGINILAKLMGKGVNNYIVLAGTYAKDLDEKLGYCGADVILYAQTLGLNTWWIGGMFSDKGVKRNLPDAAAKVNGVIAIGYGLTQGVQHKSKTASQISQYNGKAPQWFTDGVDALLYAPTAMNKQAYAVKGDGNRVYISYNGGHFAGIDLGIGKYHFEAGAGIDNFEWANE